MVKRPAQIPKRVPLSDKQIAQASFVGSPEHKNVRWWGGLPEAHTGPNGIAKRPRKQRTTICPLFTKQERDRATGWVREALRSDQLRYFEGDKDFPKRVWYRDGTGQLWTGFCVNGVLGQYKGWPIEEEERVEVFG